MARTQSDIMVAGSVDQVMATIVDFPSYPQWATGMKQVSVLSTGEDGRPLDVRFALAVPPIRDEFTLRYTWDPSGTRVSWELVGEASTLTAMDGSYRLTPVDEGAAATTKVTYVLQVDVSIPMLGLLKRKAEKVIIDTALKGLKKRVESHG